MMRTNSSMKTKLSTDPSRRRTKFSSMLQILTSLLMLRSYKDEVANVSLKKEDKLLLSAADIGLLVDVDEFVLLLYGWRRIWAGGRCVIYLF